AGWGSSVIVHETVLGAQRAEIEFSDACQDVLDEHLLVQAVLEVMPVAGQPNRDIHCVPLERCLLGGFSLIPHGDGPAMRTGAVLCSVNPLSAAENRLHQAGAGGVRDFAVSRRATAARFGGEDRPGAPV